MVDKYDKATRSRMMSAVKPRGNKSTEQKMVVLLRKHSLAGWRRHYSVLGTPDFCWPKLKVALFVDGCFWHGCPSCRRAPKSNQPFWEEKVHKNIQRDRKVSRGLRKTGWSVLRVRECQLAKPATVARIKRALRNN